ncbi:hypothetical protein DEU56DRAFT_789275, partial [Suillus clintonianus]|uniref:uncharacterized protein n=1 Tax=Suillus clintonianus TaxID=1904413 RepID=UPI001B85DD05
MSTVATIFTHTHLSMLRTWAVPLSELCTTQHPKSQWQHLQRTEADGSMLTLWRCHAWYTLHTMTYIKGVYKGD